MNKKLFFFFFFFENDDQEKNDKVIQHVEKNSVYMAYGKK